MTPVHAYGITDLARRYGVSRRAVTLFLHRAARDPVPLPEPGIINALSRIYDAEEWEAYETARRDAGLPLPGDRRRGPRRRSEQAP